MPSAQKTPTRAAPEDPDAQTLVGRVVVCPGEIFNAPGQVYRGVVTGTPKTKGRSRSRCYVKFEGEDTTEYWFPAKDVAGWLEDKTGLRAKAHASATPEISDTSAEYTQPSAAEQPTTSEFESSEAALGTDDEGRPRAKLLDAASGPAQRGAEYGVPLGITLAVLVFAGVLWFFAQLWVSERRLSHSSIPASA